MCEFNLMIMFIGEFQHDVVFNFYFYTWKREFFKKIYM